MLSTLNTTLQTPSGAVSTSVDKTVEATKEIDVAIASDATNAAVDFELDVSRCHYLFLLSDVAVLVETNDGTSPTDTITLEADEPYVWMKNVGPLALPNGDDEASLADITKLYLTNQSSPATAGTLKVRCGYDPNTEVA